MAGKRHVKGTLCADYVKIIKKSKDVDWDKYLEPEDKILLEETILPSQWYSMQTFMRMGLAVFKEIVGSNLETVHGGGRVFMNELVKTYKNLVVVGDPLRSMEKFKIMRSRFFDFECMEVKVIDNNTAELHLNLGFGKEGDKAYTHHMVGAFERLLEMCESKEIQTKIIQKSWEGSSKSVVELKWK